MPTYYYLGKNKISMESGAEKPLNSAMITKALGFMPQSEITGSSIMLFNSSKDAKSYEQKHGDNDSGRLIFTVTGPEAKSEAKRSKSAGVSYQEVSPKGYKIVAVEGHHLGYQNYQIQKDGALVQLEASSEDNSDEKSEEIKLSPTKDARSPSYNGASLLAELTASVKEDKKKSTKKSAPKAKPAAASSSDAVQAPLLPEAIATIATTSAPVPTRTQRARASVSALASSLWQKMRHPLGGASVQVVSDDNEPKKPSRTARAWGATKAGVAAAWHKTWDLTKKWGPIVGVVVVSAAIFTFSGGSAAFMAWMLKAGVNASLAWFFSAVSPIAIGVVNAVVATATAKGCKAAYHKYHEIQKARVENGLAAKAVTFTLEAEKAGFIPDSSSFMIALDDAVKAVEDPYQKSRIYDTGMRGLEKWRKAAPDAQAQVKKDTYAEYNKVAGKTVRAVH